jgi:hypothetical protein
LVLAARGEIDFPVFLFANVGDDSEDPATLNYVRDFAQPYADAHGIELHQLSRRTRDGRIETLWQRLVRKGSRSIPIPVRMSHNGAPGTRSCTADFKMRVIYKWQRQHGATKDNPAVAGLGISLDESHRMRRDSGFPAQVLEYPLLDLRINREKCKRIIRSAGLPVPPKSACFFCPFHSVQAWVKLHRERPDLFRRAVCMERLLNIRRKRLGRDLVYFSRYAMPLDEAIGAHAAQLPIDYDGPEVCESGHCWT